MMREEVTEIQINDCESNSMTEEKEHQVWEISDLL
jgi:hypothetical protein